MISDLLSPKRCSVLVALCLVPVPVLLPTARAAPGVWPVREPSW